MFCTNCGKQVPEGARFCPNCGAPVQAIMPAAVPEPPAAAEPAPIPEVPVYNPVPVPEEPVYEPVVEPEMPAFPAFTEPEPVAEAPTAGFFKAPSLDDLEEEEKPSYPEITLPETAEEVPEEVSEVTDFFASTAEIEAPSFPNAAETAYQPKEEPVESFFTEEPAVPYPQQGVPQPDPVPQMPPEPIPYMPQPVPQPVVPPQDFSAQQSPTGVWLDEQEQQKLQQPYPQPQPYAQPQQPYGQPSYGQPQVPPYGQPAYSQPQPQPPYIQPASRTAKPKKGGTSRGVIQSFFGISMICVAAMLALWFIDCFPTVTGIESLFGVYKASAAYNSIYTYLNYGVIGLLGLAILLLLFPTFGLGTRSRVIVVPALLFTLAGMAACGLVLYLFLEPTTGYTLKDVPIFSYAYLGFGLLSIIFDFAIIAKGGSNIA